MTQFLYQKYKKNYVYYNTLATLWLCGSNVPGIFYQIAMHAGKMGVTEFILRTKEFQL